MEKLLDLYARPRSKAFPVICLDEKPIQLLRDSRTPAGGLRPGKIAKRDYEYVRCGTANIFAAVEPKAGRHLSRVTRNRSAREFAKMLAAIARRYRRAKRINLVLDNLNTHCVRSLERTYGRRRGHQLWHRFSVYYTPKHASWLNQAETEISLLTRQAFGRSRVPDLAALRCRVGAWNIAATRKHVTIDWRFTKGKARKIFGYLSTKTKPTRH